MPVHNKRSKPMTAEVKALLKQNGISPVLYIVKQDLQHSVIVMHALTGEFKVLDK